MIENWPSLCVLYSASDAMFFERFARLYMNEVSNVNTKEMEELSI